MAFHTTTPIQYGGLTRGKRIINDESRMNMWETLQEIQDGRFAKEWVLENMATGRCSTR